MNPLTFSLTGIDINWYNNQTHGDGDDPCHPFLAACANGHLEVVKYLCSLPTLIQSKVTPVRPLPCQPKLPLEVLVGLTPLI